MSSQVWSDETWSNNPPSLLSFLPRIEDTKGWSIESGQTKYLVGSHSKTPPTCCYPKASYLSPTSILEIKKKTKKHNKTERVLLLLVTTALGRKGRLFRLVSFNKTPTVSHSAATNQVTVPVELWNYERNKKEGWWTGRSANHMTSLENKGSRRSFQASYGTYFLEFLFFPAYFYTCFSSFCPCVWAIHQSSSFLFQTADFSAMHHGTINR